MCNISITCNTFSAYRVIIVCNINISCNTLIYFISFQGNFNPFKGWNLYISASKPIIWGADWKGLMNQIIFTGRLTDVSSNFNFNFN